MPEWPTKAATNRPEKRVLRRKSWPLLAWTTISAIWLIYLAGMMESLDRGHFNDAWLVLAVFCTVTAVIRRITSCRVVLVPGQVLIENPLSSYVIPVEFISEVEMSSGGGLKIETFRGEKIRPLVFAGSVIDAYFKTTERAIVEIRRMLGGNAAAPPENPQVQHKFRWCWSADVPLFLGIFAGAWTVVS